MDTRTALYPNTELRFSSGICCTVKGEVGRGGSCIVYDAVYKTNAGDEKTVRIKECYPYALALERDACGSLRCSSAAADRFAACKAQMYEDFRRCNRLFYAESASDSIINTINIYETNNTVYVVQAWSRENVLSARQPETLRDCISIVRQTAVAIRSIHQAGFLYLDIKPDNIAVIDGASKRIQLFDFDSLIPVSDLETSSGQRISYTTGFAALELRRGQFAKLGTHTDVYGIGALLFSLIFRRTPEAPDCVNGAVYDFSRSNYPGAFPNRIFHELAVFFRKTLAGFASDRWQSMDEVIRSLESIEKLADPVYPYLFSAPIQQPAYFIGRAAELEALETWSQNNMQPALFISGMGGIGKSSLIQTFLKDSHEEWDSIAYLYFRNNIRQTVTDDSMLRINGTERLPEEKEADYFERKLTRLREIMVRDRVLLVIDNFENQYDPLLNRVLDLPCRKIIITRRRMGSLNLPILNLDAIRNEDELLRLFIHYLDRAVTAEETAFIREIIRKLDGHTLAIELFARQISNSFLTLADASELLRKQGLLHAASERVDYLRDNQVCYEHPEEIITRLFETDSLNTDQVSALKALALFPAPGINVHEFMPLAGISDSALLTQLIRCGWITRAGNQIYLHSLIRDVIRNLPGTETTLAGANLVLEILCLAISSESHLEELNKKTVSAQDYLRKFDPYEIITDHQRLNDSVIVARGVIDSLPGDPQLDGSPLAQKLCQAMTVNLPKHEDEAIFAYGMRLLNQPEHLTPLEILEVVESVEKVLLSRQEYDEAVRLMANAEQYAVDERTKAEYCGLMCNIFDMRDKPGDSEAAMSWLEAGIAHARLAPPPERKHLLAEFLLGKLNAFTRYGIEEDDDAEELIGELMDIIEKECLPYSEICCGFATAMGFYCAELRENFIEMEHWITLARTIGEKLYPERLDFIDNCIIPPAIMYLDIDDCPASEAMLQEGIRICSQYPDLTAYIRKKHELRRYLLDVCLNRKDYTKSKELLAILDKDAQQFSFPDTIDPKAREFLENL